MEEETRFGEDGITVQIGHEALSYFRQLFARRFGADEFTAYTLSRLGIKPEHLDYILQLYAEGRIKRPGDAKVPEATTVYNRANERRTTLAG